MSQFHKEFSNLEKSKSNEIFWNLTSIILVIFFNGIDF